MTVTDADLSALAASHDIISLGMRADEVRRRLHGSRTTFVRVARISAEPGAEVPRPASAGELRIEGVPASRAAAVERVREVAAVAGDIPVSGYSLADLEGLAAVEGVTLRALLEELHAAGLELVGEAPVDRLRSARRSIEEANIAGLIVVRLTVHAAPAGDPLPFLRSVAELQHHVGVIRAFAPLPRLVDPAAPTTGFEDVTRVALSRLVVDNVPSIQVNGALCACEPAASVARNSTFVPATVW